MTPKPKFELHDEKYVQGTQKFVRFRWFFELCKFELKEFSCKGLLVNCEGIEKLVQFRWSFELQEFELHTFNCVLNMVSSFIHKEASVISLENLSSISILLDGDNDDLII